MIVIGGIAAMIATLAVATLVAAPAARREAPPGGSAIMRALGPPGPAELMPDLSLSSGQGGGPVGTRCADDPRSPAPDTVPDETADRKSLRSERMLSSRCQSQINASKSAR